MEDYRSVKDIEALQEAKAQAVHNLNIHIESIREGWGHNEHLSVEDMEALIQYIAWRDRRFAVLVAAYEEAGRELAHKRLENWQLTTDLETCKTTLEFHQLQGTTFEDVIEVAVHKALVRFGILEDENEEQGDPGNDRTFLS